MLPIFTIERNAKLSTMDQEIGNRPGMTPRAGLFILIALMGAGALISSFLSIPIWKLLTGEGFQHLQANMSNPEYASPVRVMQIFMAVMMFFIPAWATAVIINRSPFSFLHLNKAPSLQGLLWAAVVMGSTLVLASELTTVMEWIPLKGEWEQKFKAMEEQYMKQVDVMSQMNGIVDLLLSLVVMAFLPAVTEEFFFRGGFQNMMQRSTQSVWVSAIITALFFSAIHFSYYGFLSRWALGLVLGLLYVYSKNLWYPIWAHFVNNALAVGQIFYLRKTGQSVMDHLDDQFPVWMIVLMPFVFFIGFKKFKQVVA